MAKTKSGNWEKTMARKRRNVEDMEYEAQNVAGKGKDWRKEMDIAKGTAREGDVQSFGGRKWRLTPENKWQIEKEPIAKKKKKNNMLRSIIAGAKDRITRGNDPYKGIPYMKKDKK